MGFIFNQNAGQTPESVARQRKIAEALAGQAMDASPIQHPFQGLARVMAGIGSAVKERKATKAEEQGRAGASDNFARVMAALTQGGAPQPAMAPQMAPSQPSPKGGTFQNMLQIESGMNPNAVSPKGATGIAQIMPATARDPGFGVPNIFDFAKGQGVQVADNSDATLQALLRNPQVNAGFGEAYFNAQKQRYGGDERLAAAAYNAGPGAVDKAGGVPNIQETQDYVRKLGLNGQQAPQQMAQAQPQQPQIQPASMQTGPDAAAMQQLMALASNPWVNDGEKAMIQTMLQRELAKSDPATQLALQKAQLEIQKMQQPAQPDPFKLSPGETYFDQYGKPIASLPALPKEMAKPAAIQEYEFAKGQGFPGTFQDWEASKKGGMAFQTNPDGTVTFQQGSNIKPMTESQSKDTVFSTRAKGALQVFDELENGLTGKQGVVGNTVGQIPGVGNFLKSEGFQRAEQAGNEFLQAVLRKDTGAAITEGEQALYGTVYLPRPGDSPEVVAQKKESRKRAILAIEAGMTPQAILAQEQALAKSGQPAGDDLDSLLKKYGG